MSRRTRILIFNAVLLALIIASQTGWLADALNATLGFHWAGGISKFMKDNTQGLVILLVLSWYADVITHPKETRGLSEMEQVLATSDGRALLKYSLKHGLGTDVGTDTLAKSLLPARPYYFDTTVSISLEPADRKPGYHVRDYNIIFSTTMSELLFAITDYPKTTQIIFDEIPQIADVASLQGALNDTGLDAASELIDSSVSISVIEDASSSSVRKYLTAVPMNEGLRYLRPGSTLPAQSFRLFRCDLGAGSALRRVSLRTRLLYGSSDPYDIWMVDRPIFVKWYDVDVSRFPQKQNFTFTLHPFLVGARNAQDAEYAPGRFHLEIENWLMPGQGLALTWTKTVPVRRSRISTTELKEQAQSGDAVT